MLVLQRDLDEKVVIDLRRFGLDLIEITIISVRGDRVRLGFDAADSIPIDRIEVHQAKERARREGPQDRY